MNVMVTGATGFVGRSLVPMLINAQHCITVIGRDLAKIKKTFGETVLAVSWDQLEFLSADAFDAVIHLSGQNIADTRWSEAAKNRIKSSRIDSTARVVSWCLRAKTKKIHLYNASAIGIYGLQATGDTLPAALTESDAGDTASQPDCFLYEVAEAWENATKPAVDAGLPVTLMRFAVVLKRGEGILAKLALPFLLGAGCVLGSGQQAFSWIHIDDLTAAILFLLAHPEITGPVNFAAPHAVSQREFAESLASVMHRPLFLTMPAPLIKFIFGQMGKELLLGGQNVYPKRLVQAGFQFQHADLLSALQGGWT